MSDTATTTEVRPATERTVIYPSSSVPPIPPFVFLGPQGWIIDEAPDALVVLRSPQQVDGFWLNAILTHDRVAATITLEDAAKATWARILRDNPDATPELERIARFGNNIVYLRGIQTQAPQTGRQLAQLQAIFLAPKTDGRKTADLFQFIITTPTDTMTTITTGLVEMIASFRFT